jgi:hypothetical protein
MARRVADFNSGYSDFERSASDSADNPSALADRSTSDEHYDERIERGEYDSGNPAG